MPPPKPSHPAPPSARTLISSLLRQLGTLRPALASSSKPQSTSASTRAHIGEAEHISDSEASSSFSNSSLSPARSPSAPAAVVSSASPAAATHALTPFLSHPHTKPLLATLHCLFPHYLLPALDVLDRRLVTRLYVEADPGPDTDTASGSGNETATTATPSVQQSVYYVQSLGGGAGSGSGGGAANARGQSQAMMADAGGRFYEVRLTPWHCTCAAFAYGAAEAEAKVESEEEAEDQGEGAREEEVEVEAQAAMQLFGGFYRGSAPPVCKHILACVLADCWPPLQANVQERAVSRDELAGWTAGWV